MITHRSRAGLPRPVRCCLLLAFCLALAGLARPLSAQSPVPAAPTSAAPAAAPAGSFDASHLQAPAPLEALWLVRAGDNPAWASPTFDDSQWARTDPSTPLADVIHGRPNVVWYRLHVKVASSQTGLAIEEWSLGPAFEIYLNGRLFQRTGSVSPYSPSTYNARIIRSIPAADIASGSVLIALRVHVSASDWHIPYVALYISRSPLDPTVNLSIGQSSALRDRAWIEVIGQNALHWMNILAGFGIGIVALALFLSQRSQWEYLWIFVVFLADMLFQPVNVYEFFHTASPWLDVATRPLAVITVLAQILMYFAFIRRRIGLRMGLFIGLSGLLFWVATSLTAFQAFPTVAVVLCMFPLLFILYGVVPFLLFREWRRHGSREAGILLFPAILNSLSTYILIVGYFATFIPALGVAASQVNIAMSNLHIGFLGLPVAEVGFALSILSLAIIMVLRSTRTSRQQALMESEMAAAREVQQIILPDQIEPVPGFSIESVYQPAQQVGGDFFQILPDGLGGMLIVVGDVAGKGLPAAMLVSVLVGSIRTVAAYTHEPSVVLAQLNERLVGRTQGSFSTALAAHIAPDGVLTLANAGHLSPYLDGGELDLPGALPLGVKSGNQYQSVTLRIEPGSRITFYSDGVVEAQNLSGELFGFDRGQALSTRPAAEIAETARLFGQSDDITVVAIARAALAQVARA
ncbi:MAG TPA: SpoIIE family protein phosphatase [Terracidiphilus sp.]|nr:SpoIIE family protein phosphatase [Terracidiphilus sp.]